MSEHNFEYETENSSMTDQEVRTEALDQSVQSLARWRATTADILDRAKAFEKYLQGEK